MAQKISEESEKSKKPDEKTGEEAKKNKNKRDVDQCWQLESDSAAVSAQQMIKEMRQRKPKKTSAKSENADQKKDKTIDSDRSEKLAVLVLKGSVVVGAVFHLNSVDNTGEFDPFFIERIKNSIKLMFEKEFIAQVDHEIQTQHTLKNKDIAAKYEEMMAS